MEKGILSMNCAESVSGLLHPLLPDQSGSDGNPVPDSYRGGRLGRYPDCSGRLLRSRDHRLAAAPHAKHVLGVEKNGSAVRCAIQNAKDNGIQNARFLNEDCNQGYSEDGGKR